MNRPTYSLKLSPQGQLTLPQALRKKLRVQPGSRVAVSVAADGGLRLSSKFPVEKYFGTMPGVWTESGQDAAAYSRQLRDAMQPKLDV